MKHQTFDHTGRLVAEVDVDLNVVRVWDSNGALIEQRSMSTDEASDAASRQAELARSDNEAVIVRQANTAMSQIDSYLAIASPTNAQAAQQVALLSRIVKKLIRLELSQRGDRSQLDGTG